MKAIRYRGSDDLVHVSASGKSVNGDMLCEVKWPNKARYTALRFTSVVPVKGPTTCLQCLAEEIASELEEP